MIRILLYVCCIVALSCSDSKTGNKQNPTAEDLIELNKRHHHAEIDFIKSYIDSVHWQLGESNTGIFYELFPRGLNDTIQSGEIVELRYKVAMLEIPPFKTTISEGNKTVHVDNDVSEAGVHQALKMMCRGDSGIFIIPSHLAYGLTGIKDQVQPNTPLLYSIKAELKTTKP
ncbi:MAG: FKBP-type peptidyl-prolyl cis-trans isomerase [Flavobacteriales bacterium]